MRLFKTVLTVGLLLFGNLVAAGTPVQTIRTWDEFTKIIKDNNVLTVDDLLPLLPEDFKGGYALIYRPRALGRDLVSMRRPRVLMYGTDATFTLTFNSTKSGEKAKPGEVETVEALYFDGQRNYLKELVFDGVTSPLSRTVETNPTRCLQCHGRDPKALWNPYNHWEGVYGSLSRGFVDFIKLGTKEYDGFQTFLEERKTNPRYAALPLEVTTLSQLSQDMNDKGTPILRPFFADRMNDALVFKDGHTFYTNHRLGILLQEKNFFRVGRVLSEQGPAKIQAFQYFLKGLSLDENYTNMYIDKKYDCLAKIEDFIPGQLYKAGFERFGDFQNDLIEQQRLDYNLSKSSVEQFNMGLSKKGAGFDPSDPFDQDAAGRDLVYDSVFAPGFYLKSFGRTESNALIYMFYLLNHPANELAIAYNGSRYHLYYGGSSVCADERGGALSWNCYKEDVETFVTRFVPKTVFTDEKIDTYTCDELAVKSREALAGLLARNPGLRPKR